MKKIKHFIFLILTIFLSINVYAYSDYIIPGGQNIGIEVSYDGVIIIGFYKINNKYNESTPIKLKIGDLITNVNGNKISTTKELINSLNNSDGNPQITFQRENKKLTTTLKLIKENNNYKTGLYVKDSLTGIGTLTYIDPNTLIYGALGHEIIESNSRTKINVSSGTIFESYITSIDKSQKGSPGGKNAKFNTSNIYGTINSNTTYGIFGIYEKNLTDNLLKVGKIEDIELGNAVIRTVLSGNNVKEYNIKITKIDDNSKTKNIYFTITDELLLNTSGGIVQGMSGSPIIQNNLIIGSVTHVVVDNPEKGYGILITTMLKEGENNSN